MKISLYRKNRIEEKRKKAINLYKQGLTTREVGKLVGKSHTWVWNLTKKLSTGVHIDKA